MCRRCFSWLLALVSAASFAESHLYSASWEPMRFWVSHPCRLRGICSHFSLLPPPPLRSCVAELLRSDRRHIRSKLNCSVALLERCCKLSGSHCRSSTGSLKNGKFNTQRAFRKASVFPEISPTISPSASVCDVFFRFWQHVTVRWIFLCWSRNFIIHANTFL